MTQIFIDQDPDAVVVVDRDGVPWRHLTHHWISLRGPVRLKTWPDLNRDHAPLTIHRSNHE